MFTPQTGNIFCDHSLNFSFIDILHHPLKFRSVCKIKTGVSIININVCDLQVLRFADILPDQFHLVFNTFTDLIFPIVL